MKRIFAVLLLGVLTWGLDPAGLVAQEEGEPIATAILPFTERGSGAEGMGVKVGDLLFASLVADIDLNLVDRQDFEKTLSEAELNVSGAVNPGQATQIGQLTGARLLVTGSVVQSDETLVLVAKIIGTETSKVAGASVKGKTSDDLVTLVEELATKVSEQIKAQATKLVAPPVQAEDAVAVLNEQLGEAARPSLYVSIEEQHIGQPAVDPAAQTEITLLSQETGFEVFDSERKADVLITGEAFSEFGGRLRNLSSVKARVEVKAIDRATGKVLAVDRQTALAVDLTEQVAGKTAIQQAAAKIAQRLLAKVVAEYGKLKAE